MGVARAIGDTLRNVLSGLGTARDKQVGTYYAPPVLLDNDALNAYRGAWLPRKIVDIPALDSCRNWRSWAAEAGEISKLEAEEKRLGLQQLVLQAQTKARLWGGAAIYIGTSDTDPSQPLNPETVKVGGIRHLTVLTKRVLKADEIELDPDSILYGKPKSYTLSTNTRQVTIHPSRLVVFIGNPHPDDELATGAERGWGDSVLTAIMEQVKQADATSANVASLVFEAKVDVISIPNLMANLSSDAAYQTALLDRLTLAATAKGINGTLILDTEEEYDQKSANFSNLKDLVLAFMQLVSGAADIPMTRLLGQSPSGMNSTGESDIRNYYDRIASMQTLSMTPAMGLLDECLIRSALGKRPEEVFYTWRSLWQSTDKERADIGKVVADTIKAVSDTKLIPDEVMSRAAVNMLTEAGIAPGLEADLKDWEAAHPEGDRSEEDDIASLTPAPAEGAGDDPAAIKDAAPRTLYVQRKVANAAEIIAWAKAQGFATTLPAEDLHVTIAFSRTPVDWMKVGESWSGDADGRLTIKPGGARLLEKFEGGAVVLLFNSSELSWRHQSIKDVGASWDWADYQPHITLTYHPGAVDLAAVEPYRGAIELGPEIFEEVDDGWKAKVAEA